MSARPPHELMQAVVTPEAVNIAGIPLAPIEYAGRRVLTLAMMDAVHQRPKDTARRNFNEQKKRLIEGEDYSKVCADEIRTHKIFPISNMAHEDVILLTETGYSMLVKSFQDDLAWDVQRQLVKSYFTKPALAADPLAGLPPEQRALIALMVDNASIKARQEEQALALAGQAEVQAQHGAALTAVGQRIEEIADGQVFTACPSNAESITPIRARINAKYGLPAWVIDQVMAQMPYSLKPAGTVLNGHELAQGAKYIIYWIRDVSQIFKRFAEECEHTTMHRARHPFIEGDFKLGPGWGKPPAG